MSYFGIPEYHHKFTTYPIPKSKHPAIGVLLASLILPKYPGISRVSLFSPQPSCPGSQPMMVARCKALNCLTSRSNKATFNLVR